MNPGTETSPTPRQTFLAGFVLVLVTLALYWPATAFDFIQLDDGAYVTENPPVAQGLSLAGIKWAFTTGHASNWHPLTWISHMVDCSLYGTFPGGHHLTNILLHSLNTLLLLLLLKRLTGSLWPSFIVAALFGWHPAHVESVAWIAERKDVLSTMFFLLTLLAYERYVNESKVQSPKSKVIYRVALVCFALGLMSKPMLVTLPFVLLLLDYWPLGRFASPEGKMDWQRLLVEKIPFFALAFAACVITILVQHAGGAIRTVAEVPFTTRVLNALMAYAHYAAKAFWPVNLSIYYLLPDKIPLLPALGAGLVIASVTRLAFRLRAKFPWVVTGWLWFLGTLVPVIGFVQVGSQAMADRYSYIPFIGLFIAVVWSIASALGTARIARMVGGGLTLATLIACLVSTKTQLAYWHDDISLFQHAVVVTRDNYFAEYELGTALANAGRNQEAVVHLAAALRVNPGYEPANFRIGIAFAAIGKLDEAALHFAEAIKRDPGSEELHNNLGAVLAHQGKMEPAIAEFKQAIALNPRYPKAYVNYASVLQRLGQAGAAVTNYSFAKQLAPDSPEVLDKFAYLLATCPDLKWFRPANAIQFAEYANQLTQRRSPEYLATLALAHGAAGNFTNAVAVASEARDLARQEHLTEWADKLERDLAAYRAGQNPAVDWTKPFSVGP